MKTTRIRTSLSGRAAIGLAIVFAASLLVPATAFGQTPSTTQAPSAKKSASGEKKPRSKSIRIKNRSFAPSSGEEQFVEDWNFEALKIAIEQDGGRATVSIGPSGEAVHRIPENGQGVILEGTTATARGDLISAPIKLKRFRRLKVTIEYVIESGDPLVFVCMRPTEDRSAVDLEFLPKTEPGETRKASVKVHTGLSKEKYSLAVSILGKGTVRLLSIKAKKAGMYDRPKKPVFVVDMLRGKPAKKLGWESINKLVTVYGFSSIEFLHYTKVTPAKLKKIDPGLIVLSPLGGSYDLNRKHIKKAMGVVTEFDVPLIGICLGHQVLAYANGAQGAKGSEWGTVELEIVKEDPIFKGLPRYPLFFASESHNAMIQGNIPINEIIASTDICPAQIFRYPGKPWYTFQAHIEREWEFSCPEVVILWKNMLRSWKLAG